MAFAAGAVLILAILGPLSERPERTVRAGPDRARRKAKRAPRAQARFEDMSLVARHGGVEVIWDVRRVRAAWGAEGTRSHLTVTGITRGELPRSVRAVRRALRKYPESLLRRYLTKVYLIGTLEFGGIAAGGTYRRAHVFLANQGRRHGFTDEYLERAFHHELSSVLLRACEEHFDRRRWRAANPGSFRYFGSAIEYIKRSESIPGFRWGPGDLGSSGFVDDYGTSTLENDFNTYAEELFLSDPAFWRAVRTHERIAKKAAVGVLFYSRVDPALDLDWFRAIAAPKRRR